jgi:hypothetical protein
MKQKTKLIVYLIFMTVLISGVLFFAARADHKICPICNHSIVSEGITHFSTIATVNKQQ